MTAAYLNRIATAVPPHDIHAGYIRIVENCLPDDGRLRTIFGRMVQRSGIEHRYSYLAANGRSDARSYDADGFYVRDRLPTTAARMRLFEKHAPSLAAEAIERLELGDARGTVTHLLITSCTGFSAPGLDLELIERCHLPPSVERSIIGFMGCYAAVNAMKLARHIVRSEPAARVLIVNLELCTLHLQDLRFQDTSDLAKLLMFLLWGDGCAASLVTSEPEGLVLDSFRAMVLPGTSEMMQWRIGDAGFDMVLSGKVPAAITQALRTYGPAILEGAPVGEIDLWAVHPGGQTILDAVETAFGLAPTALPASRRVLKLYGNMSSATVMFVLRSLLYSAKRGARGCAMSFGPGLTAETMLFRSGSCSPRGRGNRFDAMATRSGRTHEFAA